MALSDGFYDAYQWQTLIVWMFIWAQSNFLVRFSFCFFFCWLLRKFIFTWQWDKTRFPHNRNISICRRTIFATIYFYPWNISYGTDTASYVIKCMMNASDMSIKFCQLSIKLHSRFKRDCLSVECVCVCVLCMLIISQYKFWWKSDTIKSNEMIRFITHNTLQSLRWPIGFEH